MFATRSCSRITPERGCFRPRAHRRAMTAAEAAVLPYKNAAPEGGPHRAPAVPRPARHTAAPRSAMLRLTPREGPAAAPRFRTFQVCPKDLPAAPRQAERAENRAHRSVGCWWSLLGGRKTHVPHEAARVHHAARRPRGRSRRGRSSGVSQRPLGSLAEWPLRQTAGVLRFRSPLERLTNADACGRVLFLGRGRIFLDGRRNKAAH